MKFRGLFWKFFLTMLFLTLLLFLISIMLQAHPVPREAAVGSYSCK